MKEAKDKTQKDIKDKSGPDTKEYTFKDDIRPKKKPGFLSRLFLCWMCPVFYKGNVRNLHEGDLVPPKKKYYSEKLGDKLERYWLAELSDAQAKGREPSLWTAIRKAFIWSYMPSGLLIIINVALRSTQPLVFAQLLSYWTVNTTTTQLEAVYYAAAMIAINLLAAFLQHHIMFMNQQFGMKVRIATSSLLYRKIMRLSVAALGDATAGKVVNLLSNDVNRFDYAFLFLHYIWILPIQLSVVAYLMYTVAGVSAFIGIAAILVICIPIQGGLSKVLVKLRRKTAGRTDQRIKIMNEIINGIQVIKMYAWEIPFEKVVSAARAREITAITRTSWVRGAFLGFMTFTERTALFFTLLAYALFGNLVSADVVYPLQQYLGIVQASIAINLPLAISFGSEMLVSLNRVREFLIMSERADLAIQPEATTLQKNIFNVRDKTSSTVLSVGIKYNDSFHNGHINAGFDAQSELRNPDRHDDFAIQLRNINASWPGGDKTLTLKNITMRVKTGKLCAIIGSVGSGKSSLLQLLLKELPYISGNMEVKGSMSYACQESWLFPATVRENILFGLPYDPEKYKQVCKACSLEKDFKQFPFGDLSLVGERGVSLSGGQRARINLARAVYKDSDIYLLDDPLSAVDANVGKQLMDRCIMGYLHGRTRILVTHQIQHLKDADLIIILNNGEIESMGTYSEVAKSEKDFSLLLASLQEGEKDDDGKDTKRVSLQRLQSTVSNEGDGEDEAQVMKAEERASGNLKFKVVSSYFSATKSWFAVILAFGVVILTQVTATVTEFWISYWTNQVAAYEENLGEAEPDPSLDTQIGPITYGQYILIHGCLVLGIIIFANLRVIVFIKMCLRASQNLHNKMFKNMLRAVMRFFDSSSSGRILNRFSKDIGAVDEFLPRSLLEVIQIYLSLISVLALNASALPWTLIPTSFLLILFVFLLKLYLNAAQAVKRLEGTTKSPVFGMISSTISGMSTIRCFDCQGRLIETFDDSQNMHTSAWTTYLGGGTSFGFYLDSLCVAYLALVMALFIFVDFAGAIPIGSVGLAVSQSLVLTMMLQFGARSTADVIGQMTAIERVLEYTKLEEEENILNGPTEPDPSWPSEGSVEFKNMYLRYTVDGEPVLKGLNIKFGSGWKVGIVGRTGAGKSSLISALFRLAVIDGKITIDGLDTNDIPKQTLRSKISIIPQEPVLFSATVRYNLDPFNVYADDQLWKALEQVELKDAVPALDYKIAEGGSNFSVGQRQLLCLARAILRCNKILVMDEATANVDPQTDAFIQKTIRRQFSDCTVLTIAHRLNTIMDSDKVLVMDTGEVAEFDHPYLLLSNPKSHLTSMVRETGERMAEQLFQVAKEAYTAKFPHLSDGDR